MAALLPTRRWALEGLLAGVAAPALVGPALAAAPDALTFLAVGDWGRDGAFHQREVAAEMGRVASALRKV
jgi:acid phosphatase